MLQVSRIRAALTATVSLFICLPLLVGEGCPGPITPINTDVSSAIDNGTGNGNGTGSSTGNTPPTFVFTSPIQDVSLEVGDTFQITWTASDPDNNASIQILLDPDGTFGNGNERIIAPLILEDSGVTQFNVDTGALALATASYRIIARVNDDVNPELLVVAPGHILLFGKGLIPGNKAPTIITTLPSQNIGASQNDVVNIAYCGRDVDNGLGNATADVVILLDLDTDPNNDLNLRAPDAASTLSTICAGGLPKAIPGAIVLGCAKDDKCQNVATPTQFPLTVDVGLIPPTASGDPYHVRVTMWDHTNGPVSSYAPGTLAVTALASGVVDLGNVGRTLSGARFQGFDAGERAGATTLGVGDVDGDGADDFVIVERFGTSGGVTGGSVTGGGNAGGITAGGGIGTAKVLFGRNGEKFSGTISLNSVSVTVRGTSMTMFGGARFNCQVVGDLTVPGLTGTDGLYSIARVADVSGDGKPDILFGLPFVKQFWDYEDDDPCDCGCPMLDTMTGIVAPQGCYGDLFPNPLSDNSPCQLNVCPNSENMTSFDSLVRQSTECSNSLDAASLTSIDGGYALLVGSEDITDGGSVSLNLVGQKLGGLGSVVEFSGARWRGAWFDQLDFSQTKSPLSIIPDNRFGETVNSMPAMTDTRPDIPSTFGSTLLVSAPNGARGRGMVHIFSGGTNGLWTNGSATPNSLSFPIYSGCVGQCGPFASVGRGLLFLGGEGLVTGKAVGDHLGYAAAAGDFNLDGPRDILMGAPGASRVPPGGSTQVLHGGAVYIIFGRPDFGGYDLSISNPPRMEIQGTNDEDQFGFNQTVIGDVNQDSIADIAFSSQFADGPGGVDAGFIGIIFGGRQLTGENIFTVSQVGTAQLPGCKLFGSQPGGHAGASISNVGDFNGDGNDDLLISAPDETVLVNGQTRRGVAYLVFGGPHLDNASLSLSQIGTAQLPGIMFVTPYVLGSAEEAPIDSVSSAGDINGDGFADILIGVSTADFVNPLEPSQRRLNVGEAYLIYGSNAGSNGVR